jgi:uncharacterized Rossmann fold enzyme
MKSQGNPIVLIPSSNKLLKIQDQVRAYFGWEESEDICSAEELLQRVEKSRLEKWSHLSRSAALDTLHRTLVTECPRIAVLGAAIEPEEVIENLNQSTIMVAADGASGVLSELPNQLSEIAWSRMACIVSDADGGEGTLQAVRRGIPIVLHAHGDNRDDWKALIELAESQPIPPDLILTHQTSKEIIGMHNPGGFTDGDRASCFLTALGVESRKIMILGTNSDKVGRWSGHTSERTKIEKLRWMEKSFVLQGLWAN